MSDEGALHTRSSCGCEFLGDCVAARCAWHREGDVEFVRVPVELMKTIAKLAVLTEGICCPPLVARETLVVQKSTGTVVATMNPEGHWMDRDAAFFAEAGNTMHALLPRLRALGFIP